MNIILAPLFYKTEEVLLPPAHQRLCLRHLRPGKLLRQKIMSSLISSLTHNFFIFAVLIHMVVPIDNQALMNIHLYYFSYFFHVFGNVSTLKIFSAGKLLSQKNMFSFISSLTQTLFIFAVLIHIDKYSSILFFLIFSMFLAMFQLRKYLV